MYRLFFLFLFWGLCFSFSSVTFAGSLDAFEKSIEKNDNHNSSSSKKSGDGSSASHRSVDCESDAPPLDCLGYFIAKAIANAVWQGLVFGGRESLSRVHGPTNTRTNKASAKDFLALDIEEQTEEIKLGYDIPIRQIGDAQVPYVRFDASYQYVSSRIHAKNFGVILGYGPLAFQATQMRLLESSPDDSLNLTRFYLMYRMSIAAIQMNIGIGRLVIDGNKRFEQAVVTLQLSFHVPKYVKQKIDLGKMGNVGFEFKPAWSGNLSEYDLGLFYHFKYASVKSGYRWLSTGTESITGAYAGVTVFY